MVAQIKIYIILVLGGVAVGGATWVYADSAPIGHWIFDSAHISGVTLADVAGSRKATITGPVKLSQEPVEALVLDGATNSINVAGVNSNSLPVRDITVEAWVSINSLMEWGGICGYLQDNGSYEKGWLLGYRNSNFTFALSTGEKLTYLTSKTQLKLNEWYHIGGTYDGKTLKIYVDGKLDNTSDAQSGDIGYPPQAYFELGAYHDDDEFYRMDGLLHEVRLYDSAISGAKIDNHYQQKKSLFPQPLRLRLGPYVRYLDNDTAKISWQTYRPAKTILEYGTDEKLGERVEKSTPRTNHSVNIKGLERGPIYYYRIKANQSQKENASKIYELESEFNYVMDRYRDKPSPYPDNATAKNYERVAKYILQETGITKGYCLILGCGRGQLAYELAKNSDLSMVCVDTDNKQIEQAAENLKKASLYGTRVTIKRIDSFSDIPITKYFANLIVSEKALSEGESISDAGEVYRLLRPEGGTAFIGQPQEVGRKISKNDMRKWLDEAEIKGEITTGGQGVWLKIGRGALAGAGRWTHQYAGPDNAAQSRERLEGAKSTSDLQVQWIGRPGADFGLDRNPRMPAPLSAKGILFHQGMNRMIAMDAYNGAILWTLEIPDLRRVNMPRDASNWCTDGDYVYAAVKDKCWRIHAYTGELESVYNLPYNPGDETYDWGYIARVSDKIYGSGVKKGAIYTDFWGGAAWYDATSGTGTEKVCSDYLFACEKKTGRKIWNYQGSVIINTTTTIGPEHVFFVESRSEEVKNYPTRRIGSPVLWQDLYIVALDRDSGARRWEKKIDIPEGIVFYGQYARDKFLITTSYNKRYFIYAFDVADGSEKWDVSHKWVSDNHSGHIQHPAIVGNAIYLEPCGYSLDDGALLTDKMGAREGCSTRAGIEGAIIYRGTGRQIAMWDVESGKVSTWQTIRPSCWLSTIAAGGMVLSPEGGGGCSCGQWFETSLGFIPR